MNALNRLKRSPFIVSIAALASGTILAQIILLASSPIFTRLYGPEQFGMVAVFMVFVTCFLPCVTGKYEIALVLPKSDDDARELFSIAVFISLAIFSLLLIILTLLQTKIVHWMNAPTLENWILLAPVMLLIFGWFNLISSFYNRKKMYAMIANSKILRASAIVLISITLGVLDAGFIGLLAGQFIGLCLATLLLYYKQRAELMKIKFKWSSQKKKMALKYLKYPLYSASTGLLDGLTVMLPVLFIAGYYSSTELGSYALVLQVIWAPLSMFTGAISNVNLRKVVELIQSGLPVVPYIIKLATILLLISVPPVFIIIFFGSDIFHLVFGVEWRGSGQYAQILIFSIPVKFMASSLSTTIGATNNNHLGAIWKIIALISTSSVLLIVTSSGTIFDTLLAIVINDILLYILYLIMIFKAAKNPRNDTCAESPEL